MFLTGGVTGVLPDASSAALAFSPDDDDSDDDSSDDAIRQRASMQFSDFAGDEGGGVLNAGDAFPPSEGAVAILKRDSKCLSYRMNTDGLPPGAYTNWWVVWNEPVNCAIPIRSAYSASTHSSPLFPRHSKSLEREGDLSTRESS